MPTNMFKGTRKKTFDRAFHRTKNACRHFKDGNTALVCGTVTLCNNEDNNASLKRVHENIIII